MRVAGTIDRAAGRSAAGGGRDRGTALPAAPRTRRDGMAFASEKKSLLELAPSLGVSTELDHRALQHYLTLQYVPEPCPSRQRCTAASRGSIQGPFTVSLGGESINERYFHPNFRPVSSSRKPTCECCTTTSPRRCGIRSPNTCGLTLPSAHFSPAGSTPPRSPRWPANITQI